MNVMYLQIKLLTQLLMFPSPYKGNNEEKVYFEYIYSLSVIEISSTYMEIMKGKNCYTLSTERLRTTAFMYVKGRREDTRMGGEGFKFLQ